MEVEIYKISFNHLSINNLYNVYEEGNSKSSNRPLKDLCIGLPITHYVQNVNVQCEVFEVRLQLQLEQSNMNLSFIASQRVYINSGILYERVIFESYVGKADSVSNNISLWQ